MAWRGGSLAEGAVGSEIYARSSHVILELLSPALFTFISGTTLFILG